MAPALAALPEPRTAGVSRRRRQLKVVSYRDYTDPLARKLVYLLHRRAQAILSLGGDHPEAQALARWFFIPELADEYGLIFDRCAVALGADPAAVRAHFQKYFFLRAVMFPQPIAPIMHGPPEELLSAATWYGGIYGPALIRRAWEWPGIPFAALVDHLTRTYQIAERMAYIAINGLQESRHLLELNEHCYAVGFYGRLLERKH